MVTSNQIGMHISIDSVSIFYYNLYYPLFYWIIACVIVTKYVI